MSVVDLRRRASRSSSRAAAFDAPPQRLHPDRLAFGGAVLAQRQARRRWVGESARLLRWSVLFLSALVATMLLARFL